MKMEIETALNILRGASLWECGRAADMATFQFGKRIETVNFFGMPKTIGQYGLHVQCAWRLLRGQKVLVGNDDLYHPADDYAKGDQSFNDFDWDKDPNRRDNLLRNFFAEEQEVIVHKIEAGLAGAFKIVFNKELTLEVFPNISLNQEYWRLLRNTGEKSHFVVTASGVED